LGEAPQCFLDRKRKGLLDAPVEAGKRNFPRRRTSAIEWLETIDQASSEKEREILEPGSEGGKKPQKKRGKIAPQCSNLTSLLGEEDLRPGKREEKGRTWGESGLADRKVERHEILLKKGFFPTEKRRACGGARRFPDYRV